MLPQQQTNISNLFPFIWNDVDAIQLFPSFCAREVNAVESIRVIAKQMNSSTAPAAATKKEQTEETHQMSQISTEQVCLNLVKKTTFVQENSMEE